MEKIFSNNNTNNEKNKEQKCNLCKFKKCLCNMIPEINLKAEFCLLQHQDEQFRATNTGILLEQSLQKCDKYIWQRKIPNPKLIEKLNDPKYQPYLLYPGSEENPSVKYPINPLEKYVKEKQQQEIEDEQKKNIILNKIPYFIIIDGIWKEAAKILNQSDYLQKLPRLELNPENDSQFMLRRKQKKQGLCTCEVAIFIIRNYLEEQDSADKLEIYFQAFMEQFKMEQTKRVLPLENVIYDRFTRKKMLISDYLNMLEKKKEIQ